ncbi:hypothetical protein LCGC14_1584320 [marine sediment metagenome]|uniref:Uncharacterized protein n=1 Tax=marine sediment metagenome TaxID=412755 RepID=A0A0F9J216_9ZZZZ
MKHEYVCRECEEPCVLTICLKADTMPDECPWMLSFMDARIATWVDLEKPDND